MKSLPNPNSCRFCGIDERGHARQWTTAAGWHTWTAPADEQRKTRMIDQRRELENQLYAEDPSDRADAYYALQAMDGDPTMTTSIPTTIGPVTVEALQAAPGLIVFEAPDGFRPDFTHRWLLAHHAGHVIAGFDTPDTATAAAARVGEVVDWTKSVMTAAQQISLSLEGGPRAFLALLTELGGHDPNATD